MNRRFLLSSALMACAICAPAPAEQIPVRHIQLPMHKSMLVRSQSGEAIAHVDYEQSVQGDMVNVHLVYRFSDGSIDDESATFRQRGMFRLMRSRHSQSGPFFRNPFDLAVEAANGMATTRTKGPDGVVHAHSQRVGLPDDLANGIVGTLLINVPQNTAPFRVGLLAPVGGGRLVQLVISPDSEQTFHMAGQTLKATVFRVHPELGGIVGLVARLIGVQPKDVMVWVHEGDTPAVVRIVGQLGGYGPVVSSELEGTSFDQ